MTDKTRIIKRTVLVLAAVVAALLLSACSGKKQVEPQPETDAELTVVEYQEKMREIVNQINMALNGVDTEDSSSVVAAIPGLKDLYTQVSDLPAPEQLKEPANDIKDICAETIEMLDLTEKVLTIDENNVTADDMQNVSRLQEKTTSLEDLQTKLDNALTLVFYTTSDGETISETVIEDE